MDEVAKMRYCETHDCWYNEDCLACFYEKNMVKLLAENHKATNKIQNLNILIGTMFIFMIFIIIRSL